MAMKPLRIQARVLLLALIPLLAVSGLIAVHLVANRIRDVDTALRDRGQAIARQMAPACEYGVFAGNREVLQVLVQAALLEKDVRSVTIRDAASEVLAQGAQESGEQGRESRLVFEAPIFHNTLLVEDEWSGSPVAGRRAGTVAVELGTAGSAARQKEILVESLLLMLAGFLITAAIAWRLGQGITVPVIRLTRAVERIRQGDLAQRVPTESQGELGTLEQGVNVMVEALREARQREQQRAEEKLFHEQVRAQVTLESIGDGVITTDAGGYILYMNPVAEDLTGWPLADAEGLPMVEVFKVIDERIGHERDYPLHVSLRDGRMMRHESRHSLLRRDGRRFSIQDSAAPIRDREGRILGTVVVFHDTTEMQHLVSRMSFLASHDSLTGLLNRHEFEVRLHQALEGARTENRRHAVCYLDLDQFKIVNDTCGHVAGDELLKQLTHQLHGRVRSADVLARLGGDEFGVILHDCDLESAYRLADELRQAVRDFRFAWGDRSFEIGVSIGLVPISAESGSMTDVLSAADSACYVAKDLGRNRVHIYQPDDDELSRRHGEMQWVQRINDGLAQNRFQLYGQRIVPIGRPGPGFCEILLRLREHDQSLVPPSAFIPAAERYYLMPVIDRWVVAQAFSLLSDGFLACADQAPEFVAINLSGQSLGDDQFLEYVIDHLQRSAIPPERICFEITETAAIANLSRAVTFIARLRDLGCRFALDDFGSGLSSFGYLKNLPVNYLKIAGNFIQDMAIDPVDHAMVDAINQIGHVIGLTTIAESVENDAILERLREMGVDYAQGYGVHAPEPLSRILTPSDSTRHKS
jgi:diguanylate cyclase (GGDEF)-like protein/PAS domain S-box-containing protein